MIYNCYIDNDLPLSIIINHYSPFTIANSIPMTICSSSLTLRIVPSLSPSTIILHHYPWLSTIDHYWPLLTIINHYESLLIITSHYPWLTSMNHYEPFLTIVNHYSNPRWFFINIRPYSLFIHRAGHYEPEKNSSPW